MRDNFSMSQFLNKDDYSKAKQEQKMGNTPHLDALLSSGIVHPREKIIEAINADMEANKQVTYRDAMTGGFVSAETAAANPEGTVKDTVYRKFE